MVNLQIAVITLGLVCLPSGYGRTPYEDAVLNFGTFLEGLRNKTGRSISENVKLTSRLTGGKETAVGEFPFIASLRFRPNLHFCGGSILSERYILTAAHCVVTRYTRNPRKFEVVVGEHDTTGHNGREQVLKVAKILVHHLYYKKNMKNDVAVLKLKTAIDLSSAYAAPVAIPSKAECDAMAHDDCTVTGWGGSIAGGSQSDVLISAPTEILLARKCKDAYGCEIEMGREICARSEGSNTCYGDSGGPLTCKNSAGKHRQFGIISWGFRCAHSFYPGVFTKVCKYQRWILRKAGLNSQATPP